MCLLLRSARAMASMEHGCCFPKEEMDNELLGINKIGKERVEEVMRTAIDS